MSVLSVIQQQKIVLMLVENKGRLGDDVILFLLVFSSTESTIQPQYFKYLVEKNILAFL